MFPDLFFELRFGCDHEVFERIEAFDAEIGRVNVRQLGQNGKHHVPQLHMIVNNQLRKLHDHLNPVICLNLMRLLVVIALRSLCELGVELLLAWRVLLHLRNHVRVIIQLFHVGEAFDGLVVCRLDIVEHGLESGYLDPLAELSLPVRLILLLLFLWHHRYVVATG